MSARRSLVRVLLLLALLPAALAAQTVPPTPAPDSERLGCALHPSPDCRVFGITEFGFAFGPDTRPREWWESKGGTTGELTLSGGAMRNVTGHDALGGYWFLVIDGGGGAATGPSARYRRWFTPRRSLDAGAGVVVAGSDEIDQGSVLGHIRFNPTPSLGLVVRPEQLRASRFTCDTRNCYVASERDVRVMAGADLTGKAGAIGLRAYGIAVGALVVVFAVAFAGD